MNNNTFQEKHIDNQTSDSTNYKTHREDFICVNRLSCSDNGHCNKNFTDCICKNGYSGEKEEDGIVRKCYHHELSNVKIIIFIVVMSLLVLLMGCVICSPSKDPR